MSFFEQVILAPADPILSLTAQYRADTRANKVNLGVGIYMDEALKSGVLPSVKAAERYLLEDEKSKEYLAIEGDALFREMIGQMIFGTGLWKNEKNRIIGFQSIGGTGGLKIGGTLLKEELGGRVYISAPTWPNHKGVFLGCGLSVESYPYYNIKDHRFEFGRLAEFLEGLEAGSIVVLHACCHNPTGCDPTLEEWKILCEIFKKRRLIPFFDCAYQGFGKGIEEDAGAIRLFVQEGLEILLSVSNSKNFSMYGERVGCFFVVTNNAKNVESRVKQMVRTNYSNPHRHGSMTVAHILDTPALKKQWEDELRQMRERINRMRKELHDRLAMKSGIDFSHLMQGIGMFGYCGLEKPQVDRLISEFGIYMTQDGRINVCGLTQKNIEYVVNAIVEVVG